MVGLFELIFIKSTTHLSSSHLESMAEQTGTAKQVVHVHHKEWVENGCGQINMPIMTWTGERVEATCRATG